MRLITVVKSLIIPNITYIATITIIPDMYLTQIKKLIYQYIWNSKLEEVKIIHSEKDILKGRIQMPDIDTCIKHFK